MGERFLWGAATSAHQVEGDNYHNDWWAWEQATPTAEKSGRACDHYNRFAEDFALAKSLGHNAHRFSLEWSRFEPRPGEWDQSAFDHYRQVLRVLRDLGLTPMVTLHHFANPQWIAEQNGWANPATVGRFMQYVERVVNQLGDLVDVWLTINEPMVYASQGYWHGSWPPHKRTVVGMIRVLRHMAQAHRQAYRLIHRRWPKASVGLPHSVIAYRPARSKEKSDQLVAWGYHWWYNDSFLQMTRGCHDFLGLNYYLSARKGGQWWPPRLWTVPWSSPTSDIGWPIYAAGLTELLLAFQRYHLPIFITENGLADALDAKRPDFIRQHLRAIEQAQRQGADVRGYFHWSLLDNFEWADGFKPRFGLVAVDFKTQRRTPRPSAYVYKAIIETAA